MKPPCDCCQQLNGQWIADCSCLKTDDAQRAAVWCEQQNESKPAPLASKQEMIDFLVCWSHDGNLQTFVSRERFRKAAVELIQRLRVAPETNGDDARRTAEYWKAEHLAGNKEIEALREEVAKYKAWEDCAPEKAPAAQPAPETWIPAWLRQFHCQCEPTGDGAGQCVACQAADLIARGAVKTSCEGQS